jgi:predicted RNA binding protein YcfA (HicA-like mRNA interferase family)
MELPRISGEKALKAFKRMGYEEIRIRGSHHYLLSSTGSFIAIPVHSGKSIAPKTFQSILQAAGITQEEFEQYL